MRKEVCYFFPSIIGDDGHCAKFRLHIEHLFDFKIVKYPGLSSRNCLLLSFDSIALHLAQNIINEKQERIYLCGYSFGASMAFEVSKILSNLGTEVAGTIIIDGPSPTMTFDLQKEYDGFALPQRSPLNTFAKSTLAFVLRRRPLRLYFEFLINFLREKTKRDLTRNATKTLREKARMETWTPSSSAQGGLVFVSSQFAPYSGDLWARLCPKMSLTNLEARHLDLIRGANASLVANVIERYVRT